jgi:hypothetical protein
VAFSTTANAQVDLKINPIGVLFKNIQVASEFGVSENFGVELTAGYGWDRLSFLVDGTSEEEDFKGSVYRLGVNGRYYLNPSDKGLNRFYIGAFSRYKGGRYSLNEDKVSANKFSLGFLLGTKIVAANEKLLFDFGIGFGRALVNKYTNDATGESEDVSDVPFFNFDIPLYVSIGYRIGGGK